MTQPFIEGSRVVGYCRDSGGASQGLSIVQQREAIGKFCAEQSLILSRVFEDAARSGASTAGRDQFLAMLAYLSGKVQEKGIILWEFARMSRDYNDLMYFVSDLKRQGYIIHSINDSVPEGLEGSLLLGVKAYANAKFLLDLGINVRRGLHYVVRTYSAHIGRVPTGYRLKHETIGKRRGQKDKKEIPHVISHLIPDPKIAPLIKRAFELRAKGQTYKEIGQQLKLFTWYSNYGKLFTNKIYMGVKEYGDELIENYCPPIVSKELWQAARIVQEARASRTGYNPPSFCSIPLLAVWCVILQSLWLPHARRCGGRK